MRDETNAGLIETIETIEKRDSAELPATTKISAETWADIRAAYLAGATAREVRRRWGVPESTLYREAAAGGWTKKKAGDAAARARADDSYARDATRDGAIAAHFNESDDVHDDDAAAMGARALAASATAMRHGDVARARGLVQMAEAYYRIAPRQQPGQLWHMIEVLTHEGTADALFEGIEDDTHPVKLRYREWKADKQARAPRPARSTGCSAR